MPLQERTCPTCRSTTAIADSYCSSCGAVLTGLDEASRDFTPLALTQPDRPAGLHPLHIVPDTSRQRRKMMRRSLALLATIAIIGLFAVSLWLLGEGEDGAPVLALAIGSGALTALALGSWINFAIRRARKRARRHDWRMSAS